MTASTSQTRQQFPLSTKKVLKKTLAGSLIWSILFFMLFVGAFFISGKSSAFLLISLGIFVILFIIITVTYLYQRWYYAVYFYDLNNNFIVIRKGPITPKEITIPYERVQDVYMDQDLLDRMFGLYDVHLSSATITSGMEAHIDGVEKAAADGLRQLLLQTVTERIRRNQPQQVPNHGQ